MLSMMSFFNTQAFFLLILCFNKVLATENPSQKAPDPQKELQSSMLEAKKMNDSMQKINVIFQSCHMNSDCIIPKLNEMVEKDNDNIAKALLEDFESRQQMSKQLLENCYAQEKSKVSEALTSCTPNSDKCIETKLLSLIESGNFIAELALLGYYKQQNNAEKALEWKQKIESHELSGNAGLNECLRQALHPAKNKADIK
jgi:hypothetical protein